MTTGRFLRLLVAGAAGLAAVAPAVRAAVTNPPNDPLFSQQWGLQQIGAPGAWARSTGTGVLVGVVDTGVDLQHEDLSAKIVATTACINTNGAASNCSTTPGDVQDVEGHGTHVSGIAAAATGNGKGIAGVAPSAGLLEARVFTRARDGSTGASTDDVNAGIAWVVDHGARVVNLSLGDPDFLYTDVFGSGLNVGIEYAWQHGAIPVLAAGNTNVLGLGSSQYGNLDAVVVAATDRNDQVTDYSSPTGSAKWAIAAPGGADPNVDSNPQDEILSTWPGNKYADLSGTSMAAPHVSGTLALLLAQGYSPTAAISRLLTTANRSVACGSSCAGRLDAAAAVGTGPPPSPTTTTTVAPRPTRPPGPGGGGGSIGGGGAAPTIISGPQPSATTASTTAVPGEPAPQGLAPPGGGGAAVIHRAGKGRGTTIWVLAGLALTAAGGTVAAATGVLRRLPRGPF